MVIMIILDISITSVAQSLNNLADDYFGIADTLGKAVGAVCGIGVLFYFGSKIWQSIAKNEPIDVYPLIKPVVLLICCFNFSFFVLRPINAVFSPLAGFTISVVNKGISSSKVLKDEADKLQQTEKKQAEEALKNTTAGKVNLITYDDDNWAQQFGKYQERTTYLKRKAIDVGLSKWYSFKSYTAEEILASEGFNKLNEIDQEVIKTLAEKEGKDALEPGVITQALIDFFVWIINCLATAIGFLMLAIRSGFLILLSMVGAFAFGISCFPGFGNNYMNWIAKYISMLLWYPVIFIILYVTNTLNIIMQSQLVPALNNGAAAVLCTVLLSLTTLFMMFSVPTVVSWIISGAEQAGISKGIMAFTGAGAGGAIGGAAGASTGVAQKLPVVGNIMSGVSNLVGTAKRGVSGAMDRGREAVGNFFSGSGKSSGVGNISSAGAGSVGSGATDSGNGGSGSNLAGFSSTGSGVGNIQGGNSNGNDITEDTSVPSAGGGKDSSIGNIKTDSGIGSHAKTGTIVGSAVGQTVATGDLPKENPLESVKGKVTGKKFGSKDVGAAGISTTTPTTNAMEKPISGVKNVSTSGEYNPENTSNSGNDSSNSQDNGEVYVSTYSGSSNNGSDYGDGSSVISSSSPISDSGNDDDGNSDNLDRVAELQTAGNQNVANIQKLEAFAREQNLSPQQTSRLIRKQGERDNIKLDDINKKYGIKTPQRKKYKGSQYPKR